MVEKRITGEGELAGLGNFSRWYYGPRVEGPRNGLYSERVQLLPPDPVTGFKYVGLGNSIVVEVDIRGLTQTPANATDVIAIDVDITYCFDLTSIADKREQNINTYNWDRDVRSSPLNIAPQPHPFIDNVTMLNCSHRVFRLWSPYYGYASIMKQKTCVIRDVAAGDNIILEAHIVPLSCTSMSSPWSLTDAEQYIQARICYGGHAISH